MSGRIRDSDELFVHLARHVAQGDVREVTALIRRELPLIERNRPDLGDVIRLALAGANNGGVARGMSIASSAPADRDSRSELVKEELAITLPDEMIWPMEVASSLEGVVLERSKEAELAQLGVAPTRTLLLVGPPGVGKTQAARWLAQQLARPLLTLDLATVMSSFLGRTGNNIRAVLDYARSRESVLLLDEFDSIAKRRDDSTDVGELKRLVTVLLQAIDEWPSSGVLVAATNHPELLDPAVWRRFERVVRFPLPTVGELRAVIDKVLGRDVSAQLRALASTAFQGGGFADAVKELNAAKRDSIVRGISINEALEARLQASIAYLTRPKRLSLAKKLATQGASQRSIHDLTGIARDTLRDRGIGVTRAR
jgi:SpoVK/Ycf46/Vps4 family AAA+-type ATPase